jgi:hypothetical protein
MSLIQSHQLKKSLQILSEQRHAVAIGKAVVSIQTSGLTKVKKQDTSTKHISEHKHIYSAQFQKNMKT